MPLDNDEEEGSLTYEWTPEHLVEMIRMINRGIQHRAERPEERPSTIGDIDEALRMIREVAIPGVKFLRDELHASGLRLLRGLEYALDRNRKEAILLQGVARKNANEGAQRSIKRAFTVAYTTWYEALERFAAALIVEGEIPSPEFPSRLARCIREIIEGEGGKEIFPKEIAEKLCSSEEYVHHGFSTDESDVRKKV
jgi:hypothetical protein